MSEATIIDWSKVEAAAKDMAGNWRHYDSFCWYRANELDDCDNWALVYEVDPICWTKKRPC